MPATVAEVACLAELARKPAAELAAGVALAYGCGRRLLASRCLYTKVIDTSHFRRGLLPSRRYAQTTDDCPAMDDLENESSNASGSKLDDTKSEADGSETRRDIEVCRLNEPATPFSCQAAGLKSPV